MIEHIPDHIELPHTETYTIDKNTVVNDICIGFDIETTNVRESRNAYMYIWMISINDRCYYGRYWEELLPVLVQIGALPGIKYIYIHNMSFEMAFLLPRLEEWDILKGVFASSSHAPLTVSVEGGIEFRDSMRYTNCSLAQLAKKYTKTQKLKGDLDYSMHRNNQTHLTDTEMGYCENDVRILSEFIRYLHNEYTIKNKRIPLTSTGIVRNYVKSKKPKNKRFTYMFPSENEYTVFMRYLFRGGFVHAQTGKCGQLHHKVKSYDLTSAYPSIILQELFPMGRFIEYDALDIDNTTQAFIILCEFENIEATSDHCIESYHKCIRIQDELLENGRVYSATKMRVLLTDVDYRIYKKFYKWDNMKVFKKWVTCYKQVPDFLRDSVIEFYTKKQQLKSKKNRDADEEKEYMNAKGMLNSLYGMCVSRLHPEEWNYKNGTYFTTEGKPYSKQVANSFLSPFWGIWVTAYCRERILNVIDKLGEAAYYSDTDSIKCVGDVDDIFKDENEKILQKSIQMNVPEGMRDIGLFDFEGEYDKFKTYGAKRYVYTKDGHTTAVIAGLPKSAISKYLETHSEDELYDVFEDEMYFEDAGKLSHIYNDKPSTDVVDGITMKELGNCYLEETSFKMNIEDSFLSLITLRKAGE